MRFIIDVYSYLETVYLKKSDKNIAKLVKVKKKEARKTARRFYSVSSNMNKLTGVKSEVNISNERSFS